MAAIDQARMRVRTSISVGLLVAALAALWPALAASRRIAQRAERLAAFSTAIRRGERPPPLHPDRADAIGGLEENVQELALNLSQQLDASRAEKAKLAGVLAGMIEGVFVIDPAGTILLSNRRAEALFELPAGASCVGRPLIEVTRHPDLHALVREVMTDSAHATATRREIALEGARAQILEVSATPLLGDDGTVQAFVLVCHDVTEPKRVERSRRDFVANVSHELRTPLAAIRGYSETLLSGALEDADNARRFLGIIERHAERLGRLVDDLLILSDLELGRAELQRDAVPVEPIVGAVVDVLRDKAAAAGVALTVHMEPGTPLLDADPDRVEQALLNLVDNAIKYTPRGGHVRVRVGPSAAAAHVEIAVADDGMGIPSQDLPRLTERFYRVDKARSRELGGTGLGLAIVKHIVQAHGGWLEIESELNHGTTVRLFLPAAGTEC
jgi:two-component system phosphate regulon sensor histidine kinase PhoR